MFQSILFAVDQSRETSHGVELVASLAGRYGSEVVMLAVIPPEAGDNAQPLSEKLLEEVGKLLQTAGIPSPKPRIEHGNVPFVICDVADELGVDLVVMGNRGLMSQGQQSVSHRVIDLAPCPVLIVP
ncbi:MAG: universal stress protein [Thermostichales cyanobacterium SZTDM-1c_bins_54]